VGLSGKTALVTGATRGIGRAIAGRMAEEGARVVLAARDEEALRAAQEEILRAGGEAVCERLDLSDGASVSALIDSLRARYGRLDILINCGGAYSRGSWQDGTVSELEALWAANVRGVYQLTQGLVPLMRDHGGDVVFVNSSVVFSDGLNVSRFAATQHALVALADSLRAEVNELGIRVLSVYPGRTATPRQRDILQAEGRTLDPARLLQPIDVADVIVACLMLAPTAEVTDLRVRPRYKH
jgi:NAD(P)-dependent dehydrogenase (short-subunit alcohol dehydrogenase family)